MSLLSFITILHFQIYWRDVCWIVSGALVLLCFEVFIDIKLDVYSYLMNNYIFDWSCSPVHGYALQYWYEFLFSLLVTNYRPQSSLFVMVDSLLQQLWHFAWNAFFSNQGPAGENCISNSPRISVSSNWLMTLSFLSFVIPCKSLTSLEDKAI